MQEFKEIDTRMKEVYIDLKSSEDYETDEDYKFWGQLQVMGLNNIVSQRLMYQLTR